MKIIALVSCVFVVAIIGQTFGQEYTRPAEPNRYRHSRPHGRYDRNPCGSNDLGDYKGGCDISVPVIVMPKGRPIMERVLDWFNCGTEWCHPSKPEPPAVSDGITTDTEEPPEDSDEPATSTDDDDDEPPPEDDHVYTSDPITPSYPADAPPTDDDDDEPPPEDDHVYTSDPITPSYPTDAPPYWN